MEANGNAGVYIVHRFIETYSKMIGKISQVSYGGFVVWLRGGGAYYWIDTDVGVPEIFYDGFIDQSSVSYDPISLSAVGDHDSIVTKARRDWAPENISDSITNPGYCKLPNGMIIQWGVASPGAVSSGTITFPISFSGQYTYTVTAQDRYNYSGTQYIATVGSQSASAFSFYRSGSSNNEVYWIAIGY